MSRRLALLLFVAVLGLFAVFNAGTGQEPQQPADKVELPASWVKALNWRAIGPAAMGGRITDVSIYELDPSLYYVATASGGLLKTTNNGTTFEHQFDKESSVSLGAVCVAPSNPNIVWVGTGEYNPRNSVSYGDGVYQSTDGGKTWKNKGLTESFQIGRIVVHPKNPDIVYVGALGRLYGPSPQRGLFKTTDGGKNWERIFYLDDRTGIIDMVMNPADPDTLLIAAWERQRDGFDTFLGGSAPEDYDGYDPVKKWGAKAGIYKTIDGGKSFKKMTTGLPTSEFGRVGLDYHRKNPSVVYAIVDCQKIGMGPAPKKVVAGNGYLGIIGEDVEGGARLTNVTENGPAARAGLMAGDIITALGEKKIGSYEAFVEELRGRNAGDRLALKIKRGDAVRDIEATLEQRPGGGGGFGPGGPKKNRPYHAYYGGQKENMQDQQGKDGHEYGGVYKSIDGGESWTRVSSLNPRPMYFSLIRVDPMNDQNVYVGGIALHRSSDGGKTFKADGSKGVHADMHALWIDPRDPRHMVLGTDGGLYVTYDRMANWDHHNHLALGQFYHVTVCNKRPYWVYGGLQDNGSWGGPSRSLRSSGAVNEEWINVNGGDGFVCRVDPFDHDLVYFESQDGRMGRRNFRTGEFASIRPFTEKGKPGHRFNWNTPFILSSHNPGIFYCAGEFVFRSVKRGDDLKIISPEITLSKRGSATALAESPKNPDVLWVGADDGALFMTRNGGKDWKDVGRNVGLPGPRWVATIEPSRFVEGRAYVAFDGHRSDDDRPHIYVTENYGETWKSLNANLPGFGSTRCLREDVENKNLLYCGTEFAVFASLDRGDSWTKINNNLPTVAVHEIAVHPTAGEIVAGTHGRSLWVLDVAALRQMTPETVKAKVHLFKPATATRWVPQPARGGTNRKFVGQNPPPGVSIFYALSAPVEKASMKIVDVDGAVVANMTITSDVGLNRTGWGLTRAQKAPPKKAMPPGFNFGKPVPAGSYRVILEVDGVTYSQSFRVENDPTLPPGVAAAENDEEPRRRPIDD